MQIEAKAVMDIGVFQLLPRGRAATDREVVEQALWEVDFAERHGFESVWVTEHHFSGYGSIGVPSVYAAGIAQRTRRIRIGYGVAVVPLHHPLRLAEEISWVGEMYVLRRICVADTDAEALREVQEPLRWHREMGMRVHEHGEAIDTVPTLADDGPVIETTNGACFGSVATVTRQLDVLRALGLRKVIGWFHFGNMPHGSVRRSMQLMASDVIPRYR